jgi:hypothetical protein
LNQDNPIRLYVTHLWSEDDDYLRVFEYVSGIDSFFYVNLSEPGARPATGGRDAEEAEYRRQMDKAEVIVAPASQYVTDARTMQFQLDLARTLRKPVVVIEPFGPEEVLRPVKVRASEIVPWYDRSIVDAIRHQGRGDSTSRYEVIDFP